MRCSGKSQKLTDVMFRSGPAAAISTWSARPKPKASDLVRHPRHPSEEAQMIPIRNTVPTRYPPVVTWMLIATNCIVLLLQNSLSPVELEQFLRTFALIPARYLEPLVYRDANLTAADFLPFFTMMFLHGGW